MTTSFMLGWEEWLGLPGLSLPAIKAKIDTGARTSALHAVVIEPFGPSHNPRVRFLIHPDPNDPGLEVTCSSPVVDRRNVTSSNGEPELRYVITTEFEIDGHRWPIDISLTNRETMSYRMLLGRSAITEQMIVDPNRSFAQPILTFDAYKNVPRRKPVKRPLRIALLTQNAENYSSSRLIEAAEARGHIIEPINTRRCYMRIGTVNPEVHYDGRILPRYDAVIPRIGPSITAYGMAVLRQFSNTGAYCLNSADAIGASRDKLLAHQRLARVQIAMPVTAFANSPKDSKELVNLVGRSGIVVKLLESSQGRGVVLAETQKAAESLVDAFRQLNANFLVQEFIKEAAGTDARCFVIGSKVVSAVQRQAADGDFRSNLHRGGSAVKVKLTRQERETARKAARTLGLSVAGVDILQTSDGPMVLEVNSSPGLEGIEKATGKDIASLIIEHLEGKVRPLSRYREKTTNKGTKKTTSTF